MIYYYQYDGIINKILSEKGGELDEKDFIGFKKRKKQGYAYAIA